METDGVSGNRTKNGSKKIRYPDTPISDLKYYRTIWNFVKNKTFERTRRTKEGMRYAAPSSVICFPKRYRIYCE
jgi:hypothetical protein